MDSIENFVAVSCGGQIECQEVWLANEKTCQPDFGKLYCTGGFFCQRVLLKFAGW